MRASDSPEWTTPAGARQRWNLAAPEMLGQRQGGLPAGSPFMRPQPDLIPVVLAAGARQGRHEGLLGLALVAVALTLLVQGWLWPLLGLAFVAAPLVGIGLESRDAWRQRAAGPDAT